MSRARSPLFVRSGAAQAVEYGYHINRFDLSREGRVDYAQWEHPQETEKRLVQQTVDGARAFVQPGDFALDIGAHTGGTTVPMALAAGASGLVLAMEPNPFVYRILAINAGLNREKSRIEALNFAATQEDGEFTFHYSDRDYGNGGFKTQQKWPLFRRRHPLKVQGRNLFFLLKTKYARWLPKLRYVKVDSQGYDLKILESIRPILAERRPTIACEVFRKLVASERYALHDFLTRLGYNVVRYHPRNHSFGEEVQREQMTRTKHFDILALPRQVGQRAA